MAEGDLIAVVRDRMARDGVARKNWAALVLAACRGRDALESLLATGDLSEPQATETDGRAPVGTYLRSLTVQGFRGIGAPQTIELTPRPRPHARRRAQRLRQVELCRGPLHRRVGVFFHLCRLGAKSTASEPQRCPPAQMARSGSSG